MTIIDTLVTCGFSHKDFDNRPLTAHEEVWGCGSWISNGRTVHVVQVGNDLYTVEHHHWWWDGGDNEGETSETVTLHGARALEYIFTNVPVFRYLR